jgi:uncharacterized protein (TIGR02217 family)
MGGPERRTEIVALVSGHEERNSPWADSRRRYDISYGVRAAERSTWQGLVALLGAFGSAEQPDLTRRRSLLGSTRRACCLSR